MKRSSVKTEVWRLILVPALSITLLLAGTLTYLYTSQVSGFMDERGRMLAEKTGQLTHIALVNRNDELLLAIINASLEEPYVRAIHVYDAINNKNFHSGPRFLPAAETRITETRSITGQTLHTNDSIRFSYPVVDKSGNNALGWIEIELVMSPFRVMLYQTLLVVVLATAACLLLATYLAIKLHHNITAPISHLKKIMGKLTRGQLHNRADTKLPFELSQLAHAVNAMADSMEQADRDMQANIKQSLDDLRETMETIEVQNIELDIARKDAVAASQIKSEFLANTSHEIRTPLNGIIGFTNLALKTQMDTQQRGYMQTIQDSAQQLLKVINDILDFSKIESGKLVLDYVPLPVRQVVETSVEALANEALEKNIQIITIIDNNIPPQLMGDPLRIRQITSNLIGNAIKFSQSGTVTVVADLETFEEHKVCIRVTVKDEGIGLDPKNQKQLFNAFSQGDPSTSREHEGTGLGLAICRGLIQHMGGRLGVDSEPNEGATFWFSVALGIDPNYIAPEQNFLRGRRILICSDNRPSYLQLQSLAESWQATTLWIESIHELFQTLRKEQAAGFGYHLLLLDIAPEERKLPPALLSNLATQLDTEFNCKIIVCCTPAHMQLFQNHNNDPHLCFVRKPLTCDAMLSAVRLQLNIMGDDEDDAEYFDETAECNVLLVDDNPANLQLTTELLEGLNITVTAATGGEEAINRFTEDAFDLVFMDIQMPGMDGLEATALLRKHELSGDKRTPIVALTAHSLTEEKTELLIAGFDDCVRKPVDESQLLHTLTRWTGVNLIPRRKRRISAPSPAVESPQHPKQEPVDISQCLQLANNKPSLAQDMLTLLLDGLTDDRAAMQDAFDKKDFNALQERAHRLYGSSCYCGVPYVRALSGLLDKILEAGQQTLTEATLISLFNAMDQLLVWREGRDIGALFNKDKDAPPKRASN